MKKKLIIINGTMGVGKSSTCKELNKALDKSVWLDGDWCWMMNPFIVNDENTRMVEDNIIYLLRSFITNSSFEHVIFSWVINTEEIFDMILKRINDLEFELFKITLICSEDRLKNRIVKDIKNNLREETGIEKSIEYLPQYENLNTIKLDTSNIGISEVIDKIVEIVAT
jgi:cytidylate kinase